MGVVYEKETFLVGTRRAVASIKSHEPSFTETIGSMGYVNEAEYTVKFIEYSQPMYVEVYDNSAPIKYTAWGNNLKPEIKSVIKTNAAAGSLGTSSTAAITWKEIGTGNWNTTKVTVYS